MTVPLFVIITPLTWITISCCAVCASKLLNTFGADYEIIHTRFVNRFYCENCERFIGELV